MEAATQMHARRLGFAGLELEFAEHRIVIDLFEDASPLVPFTGEPRTPLPPPAEGAPFDAALVTHLHSDHADPEAISRVLGEDGVVLRPAPATGSDLELVGMATAEAGFASLGLRQIHVAPWQRVEIGPFSITAVPAVDGLGDAQVSWVVGAGGTTILHAGDTIFHASWWSIAMRCGPIDVAFLPVNGAVVDLPHRQPPHALPAAMDPMQAAAAAQVLRSRLAVPIHYDALDNPPTYTQVERPAQRFAEAAAELGLESVIVEPGDPVEMPR